MTSQPLRQSRDGLRRVMRGREQARLSEHPAR